MPDPNKTTIHVNIEMPLFECQNCKSKYSVISHDHPLEEKAIKQTKFCPYCGLEL